MTHDERVHYHMYDTCEGIAEHAERIVRLEELVCDLYEAYEGEVNDCWLVEFRERMRELGIEVDW